MAKKSSTVKLGPKDTLDIQPTIEAAKKQEAEVVKSYREWVAEHEEIDRAPDVPKRWGDRGRLTIASPGHLMNDPTYIPEVIEYNDGSRKRVCKHTFIDGQFRILSPDGTEKWRWCLNDPRKLAIHKSHHWKFISFKKNFEFSGYFETNISDWTINGDLVLMAISIDGWERQRAECARIKAAYEGESSYGAELFEAGRASGAPTFLDNMKTGVREFYT